MPTLNSYYVSAFSERVLQQLKDSKPFSAYWKDLQQYECTDEVLEQLTKLEPAQYINNTQTSIAKYERTTHTQYGYQDDAVTFAMTTNNIFLNFSQGMGKSFTTLKILKARRIQKALIICGQSNLQEEWLKDANKHNMTQTLGIAIVGNDTASTAKKLSWLEERKQLAQHIDFVKADKIEADEIGIQIDNSDVILPCGHTCRWKYEGSL